jgi:hypothetical protein
MDSVDSDILVALTIAVVGFSEECYLGCDAI